jgi:hypothetical protein
MTTVPTYVNSSTGSTSGSTTMTCTIPSGTQEGDFLILWVSAFTTTIGNSPGGGWTFGVDVLRGTSSHCAYFYKFAGASEPSINITLGASQTNPPHIWQMTALRGVDTGAPINVKSWANSSASTTSKTMASVTTTVDNCYLMYFDATAASAAFAYTWTNATELTDFHAKPSTNDNGLSTAWATKTTAGATASNVSNSVGGTAIGNRMLGTFAFAPEITVAGDDTGSGADTASVVATAPATDIGSGSDSATVRVFVPTSDTGSGAETAVTTATLTASDTGSGLDFGQAVFSTQDVPASDTGSSSEGAIVSVVKTGTDTGSGAEIASTTATVSAADLVTASEGATVRVFVPADDSAAAVENGNGTDLTAIPFRCLVVEHEDRVVAVAVENRTVVVEAESRLFTVEPDPLAEIASPVVVPEADEEIRVRTIDPESRRVVIPRENRTVTPEFEVRLWVIGKDELVNI